MTQDIRELLGKEYLFYDGGTGTYLQAHGLQPGELPESWNLTHPEILIAMHRSFLEAGSHILLTNTFGANAGKLAGTEWDLETMVTAGVTNAKEAVTRHRREHPEDKRPLFVSLDIGPSGHLMKPYGDLSFEQAYEWFSQVAILGEQAGADLVTIETMSDSYEGKAALLAVKENTSLPVFVTMVFDQGGRLLTGGQIPGTAALLEGLGADAIGLNCGLGPYQMEGLVETLLESTSLPVIVNPNAGLPRTEHGQTVYDIEPEEFGQVMERIAAKGACVLGGCCGTTNEYIRAVVERVAGKTPASRPAVHKTVVTSYSQAVEIGADPKQPNRRQRLSLPALP